MGHVHVRKSHAPSLIFIYAYSTKGAFVIKECLVRFQDTTRYAAHCKIDESLSALKRSGSRRWHAVILDVNQEAVAGCIRTSDETVTSEIPGKWVDVPLAKAGELYDGIVQFAPSKPKYWDRFRNDDDFAIGQVSTRLQDSPAFSLIGLTCQLISRTTISIDKRSNPYSAPSAWFHVSGYVVDTAALELLVLDGIGGSRSFGAGKLIGRKSFLYPLARSVADAHRGRTQPTYTEDRSESLVAA